MSLQKCVIIRTPPATDALSREIVPVINRLARAIRAAGGHVVWIQTTATGALEHWGNHHKYRLTPEQRAKRLASLDEGAEGFKLFPALEPLMNRKAGLLSGGEQQMLGLGQALARRPALLLADEISLGLAPIIVRQLLATVRAAADQGTAVILVEQQVRLVLDVCDRGYVLDRGRVKISGTAAELRARRQEIEKTYLSDASEESEVS